MQVVAWFPVASSNAIGHEARVAFTAKTDAPFCAAQYSDERCPIPEHADCYIIAPRTQAAYQCSGIAPVAHLEQRFRASPDVRVIGDDLAQIRVIQNNLCAGWQRK